MKQISISTFGTIKLNSFRPLCKNKFGLEAIRKYNFPPFIDGSCRREPDFQNLFPSITSLCRQRQFAPHLQENDIIVYITVGGQFSPYKKGHHLVAILQVEKVYKTHKLGESAYINIGLPIPSNCMVKDNLPYDFDKTTGNFKNKIQLNKYLSQTPQRKIKFGKTQISVWDNDYLKKSKSWECFVMTRPIYLNLKNPRLILRTDFDNIFGKLPNTRTPNNLSEKEFKELAKLIGIDINLGERKATAHN